jgi:Zn-dependent peptidase ImmA (M78 family)/transcriptional regulator with XRE-family HTH domain
MTTEQIPVTPALITWARERARFSIEELRNEFRNIEAWEAGEAFPTYPQLEQLSDAFKVPIALFFFPEPPDIPPIRESFRTLPDVQFEELPREIRFLMRKAKAFQINLAELNDGQNAAVRLILRDLHFSSDMNIHEMTLHVRDYLGVTLEMQIDWPDSDAAFDNWRNVLEGVGIYAFKDAFKNNYYSGFCLYDDTFPIIYINNSVKTRQIFTLFHELAHLLFHTSGIVTDDDAFAEDLSPDGRRIEVICNQFAAEFLLPSARFATELQGRTPNERTAEQLANRFHVSRESIFRRFLDRNLISEVEYRDAARRWADQRQEGTQKSLIWAPVILI